MADSLSLLDATAQAELVRRGELTPRELVDAAIARMRAAQPAAQRRDHAAVRAARASAAAADLPDGPLPRRAVPDEGPRRHRGRATRTTAACAASRTPAGREPRATPTSPSKFRAAGLVSLGRTNTPELGLLPTTEPEAFGPTRNPWNPTHSAPAARAAARRRRSRPGMVPAAHASDGGGSIRIPARHCGLVGLKPTRGRGSFGPRRRRALGRLLGRVRRHALGARHRGAARRRRTARCPAIPTPPRRRARPFASEVRRAPGRLRIGADAARAARRRAASRVPRRRRSRGREAARGARPPCRGGASRRRSTTTEALRRLRDGRHRRRRRARARRLEREKLGGPIGPDDVEPLTWAVAERGRAISGRRATSRALEYVPRASAAASPAGGAAASTCC